jgi:hypothetical protein
MSNTAGVLAGVFGTAATGYILQNGLCQFPILFVGVRNSRNQCHHSLMFPTLRGFRHMYLDVMLTLSELRTLFLPRLCFFVTLQRL